MIFNGAMIVLVTVVVVVVVTGCGVVCVELLVELLIAICLPAGQHQGECILCHVYPPPSLPLVPAWPNKITSFLAIRFLVCLFSTTPSLPQAADFAAVLLKLITLQAVATTPSKCYSQHRANTAYA